jgi:hypothetical protein
MVSKGGNQPGGGYGSRVVTERPVRTGSGSRGTSPGGVGQIGNIQGDHITRGGSSGYRGDPLHSGRSFQPVAFGNEIAARTVCGPGGSREVLRSGGQGTHGATNRGSPRPQRGDILSQFGPDYRRPRSNPGRSDIDADES